MKAGDSAFTLKLPLWLHKPLTSVIETEMSTQERQVCQNWCLNPVKHKKLYKNITTAK